MSARPSGVRVVMDVRPLQDPEHAPVTAAYLEGLLGAVDASPLPGESFAFLLASDLDDPTTRFDRLDIVGRRLLPPTRLLRSAALAVDPFFLRGASVGAGWRAERGGAAGVVYHAAGGAIRWRRGYRSSSRCSTLRRGSCPRPTSARRRHASGSDFARGSSARRPRSS